MGLAAWNPDIVKHRSLELQKGSSGVLLVALVSISPTIWRSVPLLKFFNLAQPNFWRRATPAFHPPAKGGFGGLARCPSAALFLTRHQYRLLLTIITPGALILPDSTWIWTVYASTKPVTSRAPNCSSYPCTTYHLAPH